MSSAINALIWLYLQQHYSHVAVTFAKEGEFDINECGELFSGQVIDDVIYGFTTGHKRLRDNKEKNDTTSDRSIHINKTEKSEVRRTLQENNTNSNSIITEKLNSSTNLAINNSHKFNKDNRKSAAITDHSINVNDVIESTLSSADIEETENISIANNTVDITTSNKEENTNTIIGSNGDISGNVMINEKTNDELIVKSKAKKFNKKLDLITSSNKTSQAEVSKKVTVDTLTPVRQRFQRIDPSKVRFESEELKHNMPHDTHLRVRQNQEMMQVKGKNFNKLKQKNKGKFYGAGVDLTVRSYQFPDSDEEELKEDYNTLL